ncbi:hypothetical protein LOS20_07605 [Enterococcus faecium]|nr:hypothetical protein [Enterococcus faecium]
MIEKHLKTIGTSIGSQNGFGDLAYRDFEMTYVTDVPAAVALNEAIELAKTFSDDRSRKFVNGVLSNVLKELEAGA